MSDAADAEHVLLARQVGVPYIVWRYKVRCVDDPNAEPGGTEVRSAEDLSVPATMSVRLSPWAANGKPSGEAIDE